MAHGICDRKTAGDSVECQYNLTIKYELYKSRKRAGRSPGRPKGGHAGRSGRRLRRSRRGLRPGSLAWHKARGGVGELPFPKLVPCMDLARWMRALAKDADLPNGRGREICRKEYKFERIIRFALNIKAGFPQGEGRAAGRPGAAGASGRSPLKPSPAGDGLACGPNASPAQACGGALPQFSGAFIQSSFEMRAQSGYNGERNQGRMCHDEKTAGPGRCGASAAGCRL